MGLALHNKKLDRQALVKIASKALSKLSKQEVEALEKLFEENSSDIKALFKNRKTERCTVCGSEEVNYVLTWKSNVSGLLLKAKFCGLDCLEYFIARLKQKQEQMIKIQKIRIQEGN